MHYLGKIIGILLGMASGAGFWGIFLGFLIGHAIDKVRSQQLGGSFSNNQSRQALFFTTTFQNNLSDSGASDQIKRPGNGVRHLSGHRSDGSHAVARQCTDSGSECFP